MNGLPRRPIEPLPPPPGSFDAVLGRARYRRHRRFTTFLGVAVVFLAGIGGGMSLDGGVSSMRQTIVGLATADDDVAPPQAPSNSAVVTPDVTASTTRKPARKESRDPATVALPPHTTRKVTGVAVDAAGAPVAGLFVYPGEPGSEGFRATREPATRTASDGSFSLACPGTPVLLSPWRINVAAAGHRADAAWAATFVGGGTQAASAADAPCSPAGKVVSTTVLRGSTVKGTVTMPDSCADADLPLWVWLNGDHSMTVRLRDLTSGDAFSISGLPPGQHTIGANGRRTTVTVGGGATFTKDVTFDCDGSPDETPDPSPTSSTPLPTPSDPPTTSPTPSSSSSPGTSGSASSTPSGSSTAQP